MGIGTEDSIALTQRCTILPLHCKLRVSKSYDHYGNRHKTCMKTKLNLQAAKRDSNALADSVDEDQTARTSEKGKNS